MGLRGFGLATRRRAAIAGAAAVAVVAAASAHAVAGAKRPDFVVPSGSLAVRGGELHGSFVVRNAGSKATGGSVASLAIVVRDQPQRLGRFTVPALGARGSKTVRFSVAVPAGLRAGTRPIRVCANSDRYRYERTTANNCRVIGKLITRRSGGAAVISTSAAAAAPTPGAAGTPAGATAATPAPTATAGPPASTVPVDPIAADPDAEGIYSVSTSAVSYMARPMSGYDRSHRTPATLLIGLHGCGGDAADFIEWAVAPYNVRQAAGQNYVGVSLGGRDGDCWDNDADQSLVLAAVADAKRHFNIDPRRVVLMGYSSGGLLAYRTAFHHSSAFAGVLAMATSPFWQGSEASSLAAASTKFPVVHIAHTEDEIFAIADVRSQLQTLRDAGFPVTASEVPGTHTAAGIDAEHLIEAMNAGNWRSPAG